MSLSCLSLLNECRSTLLRLRPALAAAALLRHGACRGYSCRDSRGDRTEAHLYAKAVHVRVILAARARVGGHERAQATHFIILLRHA